MVVAVADAEKTREAVSALKSIDPRTLDQDQWREVSMSAKVAGIPYEDWDAWCRLDLEHYDERKNRQRWESFSEKASGITRATLFKYAYNSGWSGERQTAPTTPHNSTAPRRAQRAVPTLDLSDMHPTPHRPLEAIRELGKTPEQQIREYLLALHEPDDYVRVVTDGRPKKGQSQDGQAKYDPIGTGRLYRVSELTKQDSTELHELLQRVDPSVGAWVTANAVDPGAGNRKGESFAKFDYVLVECDELPCGEQLDRAARLALPVVTATWSGSRSMHLLCRVDASGIEEFRERARFMLSVCRENGFSVDVSNKDVTRLTRLPGVMRNGQEQTLYAANSKSRSWKEWDGFVKRHTMPDQSESGPNGTGGLVLHRMSEVTGANTLPAPPDVVDGIIAERELAILVAPSAAGKSWLAIGAAASVASGSDWVGVGTHAMPAVYVNLEITNSAFSRRLEAVRKEMGLSVDTNLSFPKLEDVSGLDARALVAGLMGAGVRDSFVVVDCLYMLERDEENNNTYMQSLMLELKRLCVECHDTLLVVHHTKKGGGATSSIVDRGAGAGSIGRFANDRLSLSELEVPEGSDIATELGRNKAMRLEMVCRDHPSHSPIDLIYTGTRFLPDVTGRLKQLRLKTYGGPGGGMTSGKRAEDLQVKRDTLIGEVVQGIGGRGDAATVERVLHDFNARAGEHGLRSITETTLRNLLKPSGKSNFVLAGGCVTTA